MALSREEKEALNEHFQNKDLYDPSKDPAQEPHDFTPKMCEGGPVGYDKGGMVADTEFQSMSDLLKKEPTEDGLIDSVVMHMDDGGMVPDLGNLWDTGDGSSFEAPQPADTTTARAPLAQAPPVAPLRANLPAMAPPQPALRPNPAPAAVPTPALGAPASSAPPQARAGLSPDQFDQLIKGLQPEAGRSLGQGAMSGLAGLADAIEGGVARVPGSNFQKNIEEARQNQRQSLINALRSKYEVGYKGQELAQNEEKIAEEKRAHDLEAGARKGTLEFEKGKESREAGQVADKARVDAAQKVIEAYEKGSTVGSALGLSARPSQKEYNAAKQVLTSTGTVSVPTIKTQAEYAALPKGAKYQDSNGKVGIKK